MLLGRAVPYPKDRQALDAARKRLWGTENASLKATLFDPYVCLYEYAQASLVAAYEAFSAQRNLDYADLISSIQTFLNRCPTELSLDVLTQIQRGISCWITDGSNKAGGNTPLSKSVSLQTSEFVL
jgi:hypothetical protein